MTLFTTLKKIVFISIITLSSPSLFAAGCDIPKQRFEWENKFCQSASLGGNCILHWKGYGWWTNFHANPYGYFSESGQAWDPRNVTIDAQGALELNIRRSDLGGGTDWTAAEATLVSKNNTPINIGYGHYLVTIDTGKKIIDMDDATVFGAFTYFRKTDENAKDVPSDDYDNNLKELDMIELSKWGWSGQGDCPFANTEMAPYGCYGSAQLGTQPWKRPNNLIRFPGINEPKLTESILTTYMYWKDENTPVEYKVFKGSVDMKTAKTHRGDVFNWALETKKYVPSLKYKVVREGKEVIKDACVRFHLNFYRPIYSPDAANISKIPREQTTSIHVLNFEYQPK